MAEKLQWFQFFSTDWISDASVRCMTPAQRGWYIDLLAFCWQERGLTALQARALTSASDSDLDQILIHFREIDGKLWHPRLYDQFSAAEDKRERQWAAAVNTNAKRDAKRDGYRSDERSAERTLRASDSSSSGSISEYSYKKNNDSEFDFFGRFQAYSSRHPGSRTRIGDCRARYVSIIQEDPIRIADSLDAKQALWLAYWAKSPHPALGLWNFLAGGDCMNEPPPIPTQPTRRSAAQELMDSI